MARKPQKRWVYAPPKPSRFKVPAALKSEVETKANALVETVLKPQYVQPPPEDTCFNYIVDIYTRWYRDTYFYFCARYHCPGPNAIAPYFESRFARLEYVGDDRFNLSYMRHTGEWWEVDSNLSLDECLTAIRDQPLFYP